MMKEWTFVYDSEYAHVYDKDYDSRLELQWDGKTLQVETVSLSIDGVIALRKLLQAVERKAKRG